MVRESVAHLKAAQKEVMIDLEHFFDGYKANPEYTMQVGQISRHAVPVATIRQTPAWHIGQGCVDA